MKKYIQPSVEIATFDVEDVIMASGGSLSAGTTVNKETATQKLNDAGYTVVEW